jgi:hypothetical protein
MAVVTPAGTRLASTLATPAWTRCRVIVLPLQPIRAIARRGVFALLAKQTCLQLTVLAAKLFHFGFQLLDTFRGPSVLGFPVARLLTQFEVLAPQLGVFSTQFGVFTPQLNDFLAERDDFPLQILDKLQQYPSITRRNPFQQLTVHDGPA